MFLIEKAVQVTQPRTEKGKPSQPNCPVLKAEYLSKGPINQPQKTCIVSTHFDRPCGKTRTSIENSSKGTVLQKNTLTTLQFSSVSNLLCLTE